MPDQTQYRPPTWPAKVSLPERSAWRSHTAASCASSSWPDWALCTPQSGVQSPQPRLHAAACSYLLCPNQQALLTWHRRGSACSCDLAGTASEICHKSPTGLRCRLTSAAIFPQLGCQLSEALTSKP